MDLVCHDDLRRDAVRRAHGRNGLDYVEVGEHGAPTLYVYFLGKLPPELAVNQPGIERYLRIEGGERITGLRILDVDPQVEDDPERDDSLVVTLDRRGDLSPYTLRLVGVKDIDPRYDAARFSFKACCPAEIDCKPPCGCSPPALDEPQISYLAKDYASFRQLILDRLAVLIPGWTERHVPDLGLTLVELLAYVGDHLSYYQDAVATEAYIGTARQRISVRRHARLVDYLLHEGCNSRAWVQLAVSGHLELPSAQIAFITGLNLPPSLRQPVMDLTALETLPAGTFEYFEPLPRTPPHDIALRPAHNRIRFYTWGQRECCLMPGATAATLVDQWVVAEATGDAAKNAAKSPGRALDIRVDDVLVFEEVLGAKTGDPADADPQRRWAVRVTNVHPTEDPLYPAELQEGETTHHLPAPLVEITWATEDALPFALCLSALGRAPECAYIQDISVARGNIVLVDHGRTLPPEPLPPVPGLTDEGCCECEGQPRDVSLRPARYRPALARAPLVFSEPLPTPVRPASKALAQDSRAAVPALALVDDGGATWTPRQDLLGSGADDRHVVAEIDNEGRAHLRFGDGELGRAPVVGGGFSATYRIGGGAAGNVGAEAISVLVLDKLSLSGVTVTVRNPLAAQGGIDAEPIDEARMFAPAAFRRQIERAITAEDYAELAQRNPMLQRAAARLAWTGSWYEADVAVDPLGKEMSETALLDAIAGQLYRYRRMGHDLRVNAAVYVPLKLTLEVCALPGYERGHVKAALLSRFGRGVGADGQRGFFHPDELSFGEAVFLSRIVAAAQSVPGVECVTVTEFHRCFEPANHEIDNGVLPLAANEIAQLDNDPDHPERGQLQIVVNGGR
jgi:hypothetical protein